MASAASSDARSYPSLKIRYTTASTAESRCGSKSSDGTVNGMPAVAIFVLALVSRRFMVSGDTRNARAISSVGSPATARSVSATCASVASAG